MMEKCFDEGTLQAFLDNELSADLSARVARHLADCEPCAILLAEVEEETALAFGLLEQEFDTLVPTQRLWTKINAQIESTRPPTLGARLRGFFGGFRPFNPQILAFGSLLLIVGVVSTLVLVRPEPLSGPTAGVRPPVVDAPADGARRAPVEIPAESFEPAPEPRSRPIDPNASGAANGYRIERAALPPARRAAAPRSTAPTAVLPDASRPQYIEGEESYVKTIAGLERRVAENKEAVLSPSARFAYEKDLAVVEVTIRQMKAEVRKNPKNDDARRILFASYQNKIELLNAVNQRGELMARLR